MNWEFLMLGESFLSLSLSFPIWKIIRLDLMISKSLPSYFYKTRAEMF